MVTFLQFQDSCIVSFYVNSYHEVHDKHLWAISLMQIFGELLFAEVGLSNLYFSMQAWYAVNDASHYMAVSDCIHACINRLCAYSSKIVSYPDLLTPVFVAYNPGR